MKLVLATDIRLVSVINGWCIIVLTVLTIDTSSLSYHQLLSTIYHGL